MLVQFSSPLPSPSAVTVTVKVAGIVAVELSSTCTVSLEPFQKHCTGLSGELPLMISVVPTDSGYIDVTNKQELDVSTHNLFRHVISSSHAILARCSSSSRFNHPLSGRPHPSRTVEGGDTDTSPQLHFYNYNASGLVRRPMQLTEAHAQCVHALGFGKYFPYRFL